MRTFADLFIRMRAHLRMRTCLGQAQGRSLPEARMPMRSSALLALVVCASVFASSCRPSHVKDANENTASSAANSLNAGPSPSPLPPLVLSSISPIYGSWNGGTTVTLTGNGFGPGVKVQIGGVDCTSVTVLSPTQVSCKTGAHALGMVDVVASYSDSQSGTLAGTLAGSFTYLNGLYLKLLNSSPSNNTTPSIRVIGVSSGDQVSIYTNSACTTSSLKGTATASSSSVDITSSTLTDGSYRFYAKSVSASGSATPCSVMSVAYEVDTSLPSISITSPTAGAYANSLNYTAYTVSGSCSENGKDVHVTATSGVQSAVGTGTCNTSSTPNWSASVNLGSLSNGAVSLAASSIDAAGNTSSSSSVSITKDITAPTLNTVSVQTALTINVTFNEAMGSGVTTASNYSVSGAGKGTLATHPDSVALVAGNTYVLTWASGVMVNGADITISALNAQDLAGNATSSMATHTGGGIAVPPSTPSGLSIVSTNPGNNINPVIQVSGVSSGNTVSIYTSNTCALVALKGSGTASGTTINITSAGLADGSHTFYADQTDPLGNTSTCSVANATYVLDTGAPTVAITSPSNGGYANSSNYTSYTVSGTCSEVGRTVSVSATDGSVTVNPGTQPTCTAGGPPTWTTTVNLTTLASGAVTLNALHTDASGNATLASSISITKDITAPTVSSVIAQTALTIDVIFSESMGTGVTTAANYTLSGTGKGSLAANPTSVALVLGNRYRLTWGSGVMKNGGDLTIAVATAQDLAGNAISSNATQTGGGIATLPLAPTSLTLNTPASNPGNNSTPIITVSGGGVVNGNSVSIYSDSSCSTGRGTASAAGTSVNVTSSALTTGSYTFYANATDAGGNISSCSSANVAYTYDPSAPSVAITTPTASAYANSTNYTNYTVSGSCSENGRNVSVSAVDGSATTSTATAACNTGATPNWSTNINLTTQAAGAVNLTATHTDTAGNSTTTSAVAITKDIIAPTVTTVAVQTGLTVDVTFSETMGTGVTTAANYTVSGAGKGTLAANPTSVALVAGNQYRLTWSSGTMINAGDITISVVTAQDLAGNVINSSGTHTAGGTSTLPDAPTSITLVTPASSPGNNTTPTLLVSGGGVANGTTVTIYTSSTCATPALKGSDIATAASANVTSSTLSPDGAFTFYATVTDTNGNTSLCSTANVAYTVDSTAPTVSITTPAANGSYIYNSTASSVTISGSCSENGTAVTVSATNGSTVTGTPTCNTGSTPNFTTSLNLSNLSDGVINVTASQTDAVANTTTTAIRTIIKDATAPVITWSSTQDQLYPLSATYPPVVQGNTVTLSATASDAAVNGTTANTTFTACTYETVGLANSDSYYAPAGTSCSTLASLGTTNSTTVVKTATWSPAAAGASTSATLTWIPTNRQKGIYKFTFTASDGNNTNTQSVYITVRENHTTANLLSALDATFGGYGASSPLTSVPALARITANANNNTTEVWRTLAGSSTGDLTGISTSNPWQGSGQASATVVDPYALGLNGTSDSFSLGTVLNTATRFATSMWVKPSSPSTAGKVIASNGGGSGNGFVVRQSSYPTGKAEFVVGQKYYSYRDLVLSDKPVGYWRLGETAGTSAADSTAYANTGTYTGGYTLNSAGALTGSSDNDPSATFNGSTGYVNIGNISTLKPTTALTMEAWVYINALPASGNVGTILALSAGSPYNLINIGDTGAVVASVTTSSNVFSGNTIAPTGSWQHIVVTYNGSQQCMYRNGVMRQCVAQTGSITYDADSITIGYRNDYGAGLGYFNGRIDDVAIYSYALTSTQVTEHYQTGLTGNYKAYPGNAVLADNPIGYWRMNETSGKVAYDSSGSANNGTFPTDATLGQSGPFASSGESTSLAPLFANSNFGFGATAPSSQTSNVTLEAWVNTTAASAAGLILGLNGAGGYGIGLGDGAGGSGLRPTITIGGVTWNMTASTTTISTSAWHHIAAVQAGSLWRLYIDGVSSGTPASGTPGGSVGSLVSGYKIPGRVAEAAFYNYPLSPTQIAAHYNSGSGTPWWFCQSKSPMDSSNWNLLSTLYDGTTAKLFVNGQQECSVTPGTTYSGSVANTKVGNHTSGSSFWQGALAALNIFGTSDGSAPASATTLKTDFDSTANRYRQKPVENIVTSGLIFHMDAANANLGVAPHSSGCASASSNWWDLSSGFNGTLFSFSSCGTTSGWNGDGTVSSPYRLTFNGSSNFVQISDQASLRLSNNLTMLAWIYPTGTTEGRVIDKATAGTSDGYMIDTLSGKIRLCANSCWTSTNSVSNNSWQFIGITFTNAANGLIFYYNGSASGTFTTGANFATNTLPLKLGAPAAGGSASNYYTGSMAAVQLYNRVLSPQEIKQNCLAQEGRFTATAQSICGAP